MATALPLGRQERFAQWWRARAPRERLALTLIAIAIALALLWALVWQPLQRDRERLSRQLVEQRLTLAEARQRADAIAGLARNAPNPPAGEPRGAIEAVLARLALKPSAPIERLDGGRWRLRFDAIGFDSLTALLDSLQRDTGMRAVELTATGRVEPGQVRVEMTLGRE
jgi:general secretion pathway protein M